MSAVHMIARHSIKPGKLDEFKRVGEIAFAMTRDKEPNTQQYNWFFNADQSLCVVLQQYTDTAALFQHVNHLGEIRDELDGLCNTSIEVYGDFPPDVYAKLVSLGLTVFAAFMRLVR